MSFADSYAASRSVGVSAVATFVGLAVVVGSIVAGFVYPKETAKNLNINPMYVQALGGATALGVILYLYSENLKKDPKKTEQAKKIAKVSYVLLAPIAIMALIAIFSVLTSVQ